MTLEEWAAAEAERLLSPLGDRWKHVRAVGECAREASAVLDQEDRPYLVAAAYLHDIGYAPGLQRTGLISSMAGATSGLLEPNGWPASWPIAAAPGALGPGRPGRGTAGRPGPWSCPAGELGNQPVDLAGGDAVDVALLDDRDQRLLGPPAGLQERGEVAARAQLGDGQLELANAGVPGPGPVAVALGGAPVRRTLAELGADQGGDLGVHQLGDQPRDALAQHIGVLAGQQLVHQWSAVILGRSAIVVPPSPVCGDRQEAPPTRWPLLRPL